jgi:hypothetical protein
VTVIVADDHIDFLMARGYLETRDKRSINWAVSAFLSASSPSTSRADVRRPGRLELSTGVWDCRAGD